LDVVRTRAALMEISPDRSEVQKLAKTDLKAYIQAMKEWGLNREKRFVSEGWRKARARA